MRTELKTHFFALTPKNSRSALFSTHIESIESSDCPQNALAIARVKWGKDYQVNPIMQTSKRTSSLLTALQFFLVVVLCCIAVVLIAAFVVLIILFLKWPHI